MTMRRGSEEAEPTRDEALQPPDSQYGSGDQVETIERNPKSWAAWKREAERLQREVEYLTNAGVIECAVRNRSISEYMNHWEDRTLKAESQLTALRQERAWPSEAQLEGLKDYVIWHGGAHTSDCPGDDTCECACKPLNDAVNEMLDGSGWDRRQRTDTPSVIAEITTVASPPEPTGASDLIQERDEARKQAHRAEHRIGELLQALGARESEARQAREAMQSLDVFYVAERERLTASLTALREALEWIKPIHICVSCDIDNEEHARRTGFNEAVALMSATLTASREHA